MTVNLLLSLIPIKASKRAFYCLITKYRHMDTLYCKCLGDIHFTPLWKEDFNELIEVEFEGYKFFAPKRYDSVLKIDIGIDYMELPPVHQRNPHANVSYIDFGE